MVMARALTDTKLNEEACWQALMQRRASSDGLFFTAVKTTKIYCRPSCPSRTPLRKNVLFFRTPGEAEAAGFRACKRCKPRDPVRSDVQTMKQICRRLEGCTDGIPTLDDLAREFQVSPFHLQRTFKRIVGVSPRRYAESHRTDRLKNGLRDNNGVAAAVYGAGFGSSSRVYEDANSLLGMTPGRYGRGGAGMRIAYTITTCPFGLMLVGATERGISAISLADNERSLEQRLHAEYPAAEIARDDRAMRRWVQDVMRVVEGKTDQRQLPLDIQATAFRARVWEALRAIPRGETRSYRDVARMIGMPKAARAVGGACHANPVALVIPCHRVVREDGGLGGYALGLERKEALLALEGATKE